tara:strand:- start:1127 stop:2362 length:1236 start_codon:yes stop_codon:yes gene_type:complete
MGTYIIPQGGGGATPNGNYYNSNNYGGYQYISLQEVVENFNATYVGTGKILEGTLKGDVNYHAHRALQELSYDTLKSCKTISIDLPPSLLMILPNDYVNYTKVTTVDAGGIERIIYPTRKTSNANKVQQDDDGNYLFSGASGEKFLIGEFEFSVTSIVSTAAIGTSFEAKVINYYGYDGTTYPTSNSPANNTYGMKHILKEGMTLINSDIFLPGTKVKSVTDTSSTSFTFTVDRPTINTATESNAIIQVIDREDSTVWSKYKGSSSTSIGLNNSSTSSPSVDGDNYANNNGQRYGIEPEHAQTNGSFYIDKEKGKIHFSGALSGKTIVLHYISDGHGSAAELIVPKLAEEAMYKWIAYGCLIAKAEVSENIVQRFKKEKIAETRKAKIRLSNIKIEEIAQIMRGKSKFINH